MELREIQTHSTKAKFGDIATPFWAKAFADIIDSDDDGARQ
jgi:hypothetical protein